MMRERWDHNYHPLNITQSRSSYKDMNTTSNDLFGRTWNILNHTYSAAADKSSYEYNIAKPTGNVVRMGISGENSQFDPWHPRSFNEAHRRARTESPLSTGRPSKGPYLQPDYRKDYRGRMGVTLSGPLGLDPFNDPNLHHHHMTSTLRARVAQPEVPSFSRVMGT